MYKKYARTVVLSIVYMQSIAKNAAHHISTKENANIATNGIDIITSTVASAEKNQIES